LEPVRGFVAGLLAMPPFFHMSHWLVAPVALFYHSRSVVC
jgi:hypothetical protein